MTYFADHIAKIIGSSSLVNHASIEHLLLDSRKIINPSTSLFFALKGPRRDGSQFIAELYRKGVINFVVNEKPASGAYPNANFIVVDDTLVALQTLAAWHRAQFNIPVIGITGSNGKTIVKEWLYQLLQDDYTIVRSPKSYNSQTGVPLSVWQMNTQHTLAIFEAGISRPGEMKRLQQVIQPTIGVFTNIGTAHNEGFADMNEKAAEKFKLFSQPGLPVIYPDDDIIHAAASHATLTSFTWGTRKAGAWMKVDTIDKKPGGTTIHINTADAAFVFSVPFTDDASIQNAITCSAVLLYMKLSPGTIAKRMLLLQPVNMRLELKKGINNCTVINDSYSADLDSLGIALDFLDQQGGKIKKTVILSDFLQSGQTDEELYKEILESLHKDDVTRLIGIGERISHVLGQATADTHSRLQIELFPSTETYIAQFLSSQFKEEIILIKGARVFGFERIVQLLEQKVHQTVLEINLNAIVHNVNVYKRQIQPGTKIMAMVKAFAYGSGGAEIAGILQYHKIDYLGVAYADEGVELRRAGVILPIMVMNPESIAFEAIVDNNLEPDIYSFELLHLFEAFLEREGLNNYPVHIEIETGMNRLGFAATDIIRLADHLSTTSLLKVQSVFSHLAASEDASLADFTMEQFRLYEKAVDILKQQLGYDFIRHISNSAAIFRLPQLELDMVRLGIGMYGIDSAGDHQSLLQPVATLKTTIAQLKHLKVGESVGYNRRGMLQRDSVIATVRIGYADGYSRRLGNGAGNMWVKGKMAPVVGTVCMDMTMIDVTGIPGVTEGDEVIIFGKEIPVQQLAAWAGTIPYEIMTGISQRVKRVYFEE